MKEVKISEKLIFKLPLTESDLTVNEYVNLANTDVDFLPDDFTVLRSLNIGWSKISSLPNNLKVGMNLCIRGTAITELPDDLIVKGSIIADRDQLEYIPEGLEQSVTIAE